MEKKICCLRGGSPRTVAEVSTPASIRPAGVTGRRDGVFLESKRDTLWKKLSAFTSS